MVTLAECSYNVVTLENELAELVECFKRALSSEGSKDTLRFDILDYSCTRLRVVLVVQFARCFVDHDLVKRVN